MNEFYSLKIVFLGDSMVGKTCLIGNFVSGNAPDNVIPTIGAAFVSKEIEIMGKQVEVLIWDTAGQELYRGLAPIYYRDADIAIICFDVTSSQSYDSIQYWISELNKNCEKNIIIVICGNKIDLEEKRVIQFSSPQAAAEEIDAIYSETSAITGFGVERMFQTAISKYIDIKMKENVLEPLPLSLNVTCDPPKKKSCC